MARWLVVFQNNGAKYQVDRYVFGGVCLFCFQMFIYQLVHPNDSFQQESNKMQWHLGRSNLDNLNKFADILIFILYNIIIL